MLLNQQVNSPEPAYEVVLNRKVLPGAFSMYNGMGFLNGKPIPEGATIRRIPTAEAGTNRMDAMGAAGGLSLRLADRGGHRGAADRHQAHDWAHQ